jgi:UDP-N-acetylmuramate: L-alanyl-gamma-D-glutamyl-meso-diaminopimelate ligase
LHLHILGICGTFMGGIAAIARAAGHRVTGSDRNVYPPMSTQLAALGIDVIEGYEPDQLALRPDVFVVGNVMSRGNALVEALLDAGCRYESGPEWLARNVLQQDGRWVLGVAGTHGKTTTSSLLAWILEHAGLAPGFLIGGVPLDFGISARLGAGRHFVIEADEYDTAFFDKRAKFVHYRPRTAVLNNLEHDHADIYPDVAAIQKQFHLLLRSVPRNGRLVVNAAEPHLDEVLRLGCWTPVERFGVAQDAAWRFADAGGDGSYASFDVFHGAQHLGRVDWDQLGRHNASNAVAALAAASHAGVEASAGLEALRRFAGVRRRLEVRGTARGVTVYDDFAHHPTAITTTLEGVRRKARRDARVIAVLEPRSNTMKLGTHKAALAESLRGADRVFIYQSPEVKWDVRDAMVPLGSLATVHKELDALVAALAAEARAGDQLVLMSNGSFGGLHERLLQALRGGAPATA